MYESVGLILILGTFVQLGMEIYRLRKELEELESASKILQIEAKTERDRLITVLAAAQTDRVQHSLGFLTDSDLQQKKREQEAYKKSFQTSD